MIVMTTMTESLDPTGAQASSLAMSGNRDGCAPVFSLL
jgi:hypothetical protein